MFFVFLGTILSLSQSLCIRIILGGRGFRNIEWEKSLCSFGVIIALIEGSFDGIGIVGVLTGAQALMIQGTRFNIHKFSFNGFDCLSSF